MRVNVLRRFARAALAGAAASLLVASAGCNGCPKIHQTVVLVSPDSQLTTLVAACVARQPGPGETCSTDPYAPIRCGCLALCQRVLEILNEFPGEEAHIEGCSYDPPPSSSSTIPDAGAMTDFTHVGTVDVTYRMASCQ